jgi:hypothetical protein
VERAARHRRIEAARVPGPKAAPQWGSGTGAGGPGRGRGVGGVTSRRGPCGAGCARAWGAGARGGDGGGGGLGLVRGAWPWGVSWRREESRQARYAKRRQQAGGAASPRARGAGGGDPGHCRACAARRRRAGVASSRPASARQKTQRAAGDGGGHPHGETVGGDARAQRHRTPPDRSGPGDAASKACRREEKYSRELDNSGNIEGNSHGLFHRPLPPAASRAPALAGGGLLREELPNATR